MQSLGIARPVAHPLLGELRVVGQAINLARTPQPASLAPTPELGEHTDEILGDLGFTIDAIQQLRDDAVI